MSLQKIVPCLWFDLEAKQAAEFYTTLFKDAKINNITHFPKDTPRPEGTVMTVSFEIEGQEFLALNGGPEFKFDEAVSFQIMCDTQEEVDYYWDALTRDGGQEIECGWLKDKYGLSWQVVPRTLMQMIQDPDPDKSYRAMQAMLKMKKIHIPTLHAAFDAK